MSKEEMKLAIAELLEDTPEQILTEVLNYLESVKKISPEKFNLARDLRRILTEDKELLERLAK